jgi:phosphoribosylamine--glycine ligase
MVLVIGGGSREHAIVRAVKTGAICAPGNAGTSLQNARNVPIRADDVAGLVDLAKNERPELVIVGPEAPLVLGIADALAAEKIPVFGPTRAAARLEGSKAFMKRFLARHSISTAAFEVFDDPKAAIDHARRAGRPLVVKTDGLAAGKGVVVARSVEETIRAIENAMVAGAFGEAGRAIVLEDLLQGEEASFHVICDGDRAVALPAAQDHKRVFDADQGPNTGGMGAYAPAPIVTETMRSEVMERVVLPTLRGMKAEGAPFRGVLFVGLMIDRREPRVLEFNVRFGDPEACVLVPLLEVPIGMMAAAARGALDDRHAAVKSGAALGVVMAAENYPASPKTGDVIEGLDGDSDTAFVCHAGTKHENGDIVTAGGRVLTVVGLGATVRDARDRAYARVAAIRWRGEHHRTDIGHRFFG